MCTSVGSWLEKNHPSSCPTDVICPNLMDFFFHLASQHYHTLRFFDDYENTYIHVALRKIVLVTDKGGRGSSVNILLLGIDPPFHICWIVG